TQTRTQTATQTPTQTPSCPATDLGNSVPLTVSGSTVGAANTVGGASCGNGGSDAPDATFLYTAPFPGSYSIDTFDSDFDTVLYVRAATCSGAELACNDDFNTMLQSQVTLPLAAGQQVVIVVDGFNMKGGNFTLHINGSAGAPTPTASGTPPTPQNT